MCGVVLAALAALDWWIGLAVQARASIALTGLSMLLIRGGNAENVPGGALCNAVTCARHTAKVFSCFFRTGYAFGT